MRHCKLHCIGNSGIGANVKTPGILIRVMLAAVLGRRATGQSRLVAAIFLDLGFVFGDDNRHIVHRYLVALCGAAIDVLQPGWVS